MASRNAGPDSSWTSPLTWSVRDPSSREKVNGRSSTAAAYFVCAGLDRTTVSEDPDRVISRGIVSVLALVVGLSVPTVPASSYAGTGSSASATAGVASEVTELRVRWSGAKVRAGRGYRVTGKVSGDPRLVLVQRRIPGGWFPLGSDSSGATGKFLIKVDTRWVARHRKIRVLAPATTTHDAAAASRQGGLTVTRTYRPRGGKAWRPITGGGVRGQHWSPCGLKPGVISYRVNPRGLPRGGLGEIKKAFRMVTAATGFSFRYLGRTKVIPLKKGSGVITRNANITLAYSTPKKVPSLRGPVLATTPVAAGYSGTKIYRIFEAGVVIDKTFRFRPGFGSGRPSRGATLIHELGHAVGLDHVEDPRQMMYPAPTRHAASYAKGDLRGLAKVGVGAGCFPGEFVGRAVAAPRDVRVTVRSTR